MKKRHIIGLVLLALVGILFMEYRPAILRYRLILSVEKAGARIEGSGVIRVIYDKEVDFLPSHAEWGTSVKGEAVMVDLGDRGVLFALLKEGSGYHSAPEYIALKAFGIIGGEASYPLDERMARIRSLSSRSGERVNLASDNLPMLVRFRDLNDPKTVEQVDPNNLAASFGEGVKLVGVSIEITDDSVTRGIEKVLPWLPGRKDVIGYLGGWPDDPSKLYLNGSEFYKGGSL